MNPPQLADDPTMWRELRSTLHRFVRGRVRDPALAEDIVQDVLLKATVHLEGLRDEERMLPWLYRVTRNAITDHHRGKRPSEPLQSDPVAPEAEEPSAAEELAGCLVPMLSSIPETYREAVRMAEMEGLTQQQVADALGLSLSGAKSRVQRGRRMLRDAVERCCAIETDVRGGVMDFHTRSSCGGDC